MRIASWRLLSLAVLLTVALAITGCSSGTGSSSTPAVTISGSSSTALDQGQALTITASVSNDSNSSGVTWTLSGVGALSANTATSVTYTAPSSVTSTTTVTITATSIANPSITSTRTITLTGTPAISSSTLPAGTVGTAYSQALANTGGAGSLTWAVNSGTLPTGITLSSAGVLSGTVTAPSTTVLTFKVTDSSSATPLSATSSNITLTFNPVTLAVVTPTLANAVQGSAYTSSAFTSTGGTGSVAWTAAGLPAGLTINSSTGVISGTPTGSGATTGITVTATDSGSGTFQQTKTTTAFSLTVIPVLTVGSLSNTSAVQGVTAVSVTAPTVSGGVSPYTFTLSGAPAGLTMDASGNITGTPTASSGSPYTVVATVKDSGTPQQTKTSSFTLTVAAGLAITPPTLANAVQGSAYSSSAFTTTGGTGSVTWSATGLPAGLSIGASTGVISGTPTGSGASTNVIVTATDSGAGTLQQVKSTSALSITVIPTLAITTSSLPGSTLGAPYPGATLAATGGTGTLTWSATGLPSGLSLNTSTGAISGTPNGSTAGTATVNISVTDSGTPQQTKNATLNLVVNAGTPTITSNTLPGASIGFAYSQQLASNPNGQTGSPTWNMTSGSLTGSGLTLSSGGLLSGTVTGSPATYNFTATVTYNSVTSLSQAFSVTTANGPSITTSSLPPAYVGTAYTQTLAATGGSGSNTWSVLSGSSTLSSIGLSLSSAGVLSGTPTATGSGSVTFQVMDSNSHTGSATLTVGAYNVLTLPAANPSSLPAASTTSTYTGTINAAGGVGSNFIWTVNSTQLTNNSPFTLAGTITGLKATTTGNGTLTITGTPSATGTVNFSVSVKDGANTTVSQSYTITVSTTYSISGQILQSNSCGLSTGLSGITVTLSGASSGTTTTSGSGNYIFTGLSAGSYTVTPSITGPASIFYPASSNVTINTTNTGASFQGSLGYTVSGTVNYAGAKTGRVYLVLQTSCNNQGSQQGTSVALSGGSGSYTIHGVPSGAYTVSSYMENLGYGATNATNPTGSTTATVGSANVTGANVTLTDPTAPTISSTPQLQAVGAFNGGVIALYKGLRDNNGNEVVTSYTLQWSTDSGFSSVTGSKTFAATGGNGATIWFVNGLSNGSVYYFRYSGTNGTNTSPYSAIVGPVTVGAPTPVGGVTVSGTVTYTGVTPASGAPLYVGFVDPQNGGFYLTPITNPAAGSSTYSVQVPPGSTYYFVGAIDQNKDGIIDVGDITNTNNLNSFTTVSGAGTMNLTLPTGTSSAAVTTSLFRNTVGSSTSSIYGMNFTDSGITKLPVAVSLTSGANVLTTTDIGICTNCGGQFQYNVSTGSVAPVVGNAYSLLITYADGSTETLSPTVSAVLGTADVTTNMTPQTGGTTSTTPTFTWVYPANEATGHYGYQFQLNCFNNCGGGDSTIWRIPGDNSNYNTFTSTQVPVPAGIAWITSGNDVLQESNQPNAPSLSTSSTYTWQIQTSDANGNTATHVVQYQP